jgi:EAL and modified HD-GYP domain-containing signal transduction protein
MLSTAFIGRQAIYSPSLSVRGYELLFRSGPVDHASFEHGDAATSQVLLNALVEFGLDRLVGERPAFINLTRAFLLGDYPLPLPPGRVVLEVLETAEPDAVLVAAIERLVQRGFRIALDDFEYSERWKPLLALASIVKFDCRALGVQGAARQLERMPRGAYELLAEKVETHAEFEALRALGFHAFQGFFLSRPQLLQHRSLSPRRGQLVNLLGRLHDPALDLDGLSELVGQDVALSYLLMRHVNSALYSLPRRVDSVRDVVVFLGHQRVQNLVSLFALARLEDKPSDLVLNAMLRAKMCERIGAKQRAPSVHPYFTTGMLSLLDALVDQPMQEIVEQLPLSREVSQALLERSGPFGRALECTIAYERGDWERVHCEPLATEEIRDCFLDAVGWTGEIESQLAPLGA